jgi:tRNA (mo5U34)-methyltransferase
MADALGDEVAALEWYHTMELPDGVVTPGFFDHRPVLSRYGFPDRLDGQRVLDCGTFDGFFAFELERRGAEVVALDVPDMESLDWPAPLRRKGNTRFQPRHRNFEVAREALGSKVDRRFVSVYDASPEALGGDFDLVFVGSLLGHLRDPVAALMALLSVCRGRIQLAEMTHARLDLLSRKVGLAKFQAISPHLTWWVPNRACLAQMLEAAGFTGVEHGETFTVPYNGRRGGIRHSILRAVPWRG